MVAAPVMLTAPFVEVCAPKSSKLVPEIVSAPEVLPSLPLEPRYSLPALIVVPPL